MRSLALWIPVHVDCPDHPKTIRFARLLKLRVPYALGHLVMFWRWAIQYSDRGSLEGYTNEDISTAAGYSGDPEKFVEALLSCGVRGPGYLDRDPSGTLEVHDFASYLGVLADERRRDAERKREKRKEKAASGAGLSESVHRTSAGHPPDVHPMSTVETKGREEKRSSASRKRPESLEEVHGFWAEKRLAGDPEVFWFHYEANGWTQGGRGALKDWKAAAHKWSRTSYGVTGPPRSPQPQLFQPPPDPEENARRAEALRAMGRKP